MQCLKRKYFLFNFRINLIKVEISIFKFQMKTCLSIIIYILKNWLLYDLSVIFLNRNNINLWQFHKTSKNYLNINKYKKTFKFFWNHIKKYQSFVSTILIENLFKILLLIVFKLPIANILSLYHFYWTNRYLQL